MTVEDDELMYGDGFAMKLENDEDFMLAFEKTLDESGAVARSDASSPAAVSLQDSTAAAVLSGRLPLCMYLTCDDDHFTKFQCLLRRQIEFFETTSCPSVLNPKKQGRNRPIVLGQVGLRCMHCRVSVMQELASRGAVYYPSTLDGIYQAAQNMATHHFLADQCPNIPASVKQQMIDANQNQEKKSTGGKQMWAKKAWALGVREDTIDGTLRFQRLDDRIESLQEMFQDDSII
ncbi:hypothetical protein MPSEU_000537400 [Mayamaea pseudoterrestris]|nr:hypothetical protein MPSEU_000537400 [Mayamaea pseudoterrestris]